MSWILMHGNQETKGTNKAWRTALGWAMWFHLLLSQNMCQGRVHNFFFFFLPWAKSWLTNEKKLLVGMDQARMGKQDEPRKLD